MGSKSGGGPGKAGRTNPVADAIALGKRAETLSNRRSAAAKSPQKGQAAVERQINVVDKARTQERAAHAKYQAALSQLTRDQQTSVIRAVSGPRPANPYPNLSADEVQKRMHGL